MENKFSVEQFIEFLELFVYENTNPLGVKFFYTLIDVKGLIRENIDGEINESKVLGLEIPIFNDSQLNIDLRFNLISSLGVIPTFKVNFDGLLFFHIYKRESLFFSDKGDNPTHKLLVKLLKELKRTYGY